MASVKIVIRQKQRKDGTYPLALRLIKDRKPSYIFLGHSILKSDWDEEKLRVKKSHPNATRINNLIQKKLNEATDKLIELDIQKVHISSKALKRNLKSRTGTTFFSQAQTYLDSLKQSGKFNRLSADKSRVERFKDFLEGTDIAFQEITPTLLMKFQAYLKGVWSNSQRSVMNNLVVLRTIYNQAIRDGIVDQKHYPFGKDKIRIKFPDSFKVGLTAEEVKVLEELKITDPILSHARNVWLISFYFAGMRVSDVLRLKWSDFQNDRLFYAMGKNAKTGSLKIPSKALTILEEYKKQKNKHDLVLPDLNRVEDMTKLYDLQKWIKNAIKRLDVSLPKVAEIAEIKKPLTMHIARHTFGNISGDKIPLQMLQKLYRHTSITTTIAYQANFIHKDADEALDAVINF